MQKQTNDKKTVSFRLDAGKVAELDELAQAHSRDRTYVLNEAVAAYLDVQHWQIEHIQEGLQQADSKMGVVHREVVRKW